jgi:hypothetical protein
MYRGGILSSLACGPNPQWVIKMSLHRIALGLAHVLLAIHHRSLALYFQLVKLAHRLETDSERFERISHSELVQNWYQE